jgi:hypothetical protein
MKMPEIYCKPNFKLRGLLCYVLVQLNCEIVS